MFSNAQSLKVWDPHLCSARETLQLLRFGPAKNNVFFVIQVDMAKIGWIQFSQFQRCSTSKNKAMPDHHAVTQKQVLSKKGFAKSEWPPHVELHRVEF